MSWIRTGDGRRFGPNAAAAAVLGFALLVGLGGGCSADTPGTRGAATCGNGRLDPGESCDGIVSAEQTCAVLTGNTLPYGAPGCRSTCEVDVSSCAATPDPMMGAGGSAGGVAGAPTGGAPVVGTGGEMPVVAAGGSAAGGMGGMPPLMGGMANTSSGGALAAGGSAGTGGAGAGTGGAAGAATLDSCTPPPSGAAALTVEAWTVVNEIRLAAGAGCMNLISELNTSAQVHCDYLARHRGTACYRDAHSEVAGCEGFTGATVQEREVAADYPRSLAYTEVATTYGNNPRSAVANWLETVYHRIPLLDPWTADMGYGGAEDCDIIDIGRGMSTMPSDLIVVFPYEGQVDVQPSWIGLEAPAPPPPAGGFPSSYPVSIYAQRISVSEHVLTRDGDGAPIEHVWIDSQNAPANVRPYFGNTAILYAPPFDLTTTYRVRIVGTYIGGAFEKEWTFTTGATRPFGT